MAKDKSIVKQLQQELGGEEGNVTQPGGLNTDSSLVTQPQGTTRFVLTGVNETKEGDLGFLANEESNEDCYDFLNEVLLGVNYVPIGKVYIGDENTLLFLANPNGNSAMVIADKNCNLTTVFSDKNQDEKMGFKITQQIDATFRLRRGCERVVYWIDPKPRMFILDKEEEFQDKTTGEWVISKFNLFKVYKKIPVVESIEVLDASGTLAPGSYNFSIQYLDEDFNPTEFVTSTETISIYNDPATTLYKDKKGATGKKESTYYDFPVSNKAIRIKFDPTSLDTDFPFYRLAITEATAGGGLITDTKYTSEISTKQPFFNYTGTNYESIGSQEEVTMFNNIIDKAQSIEQIENRLVLGNIEGKQINYCKLQKFASKINADMITKTVIVSKDSEANSKDPAAHFNGVGYMPGEIYSFGIVYIFEDNTTSPVYHIPGKNPDIGTPLDEMYSVGSNIYPMSNIDNQCESTRYIDNPTCGIDTYWGEDSKGVSLTDKPVRHHRFPLRTDYNIPFVEKVTEGADNTSFEQTRLIVKVSKEDAVCPVICPDPVPGEPPCTSTPADFGSPDDPGGVYSYEVDYVIDGTINETFYAGTIDPAEYAIGPDEDNGINVEYTAQSSPINGLNVGVVQIREVLDSSADPEINIVTLTGPTFDPITETYSYTGTSGVTGMTYTVTKYVGILFSEEPLYVCPIFGIKFSNIQRPTLEVTGGVKVTGYYIVRNERKEEDRTVVDSAVLLSTTQQKNFVAQGLIFPEFNTAATEAQRIKKDVVAFVSPEHKFNGRKYSVFNKIIQQGEFEKEEVVKSRVRIQDVAPGTSKQRGHKGSDDDGWSLQIKTRETFTDFKSSNSFSLDKDDIKEIYYLNALEDRLTEDSTDTSVNVFNLAIDNKIGILHLKENFVYYPVRKLPYVYLYRELREPYSNYRLDPYYKESQNPELFNDTTNEGSCVIFNGDTYINSIRYVNTVYYDTRISRRATKKGFWAIFVGVLLIVGAVVLSVISWGTLSFVAAAAITAGIGLVAGVGVALTLSGVKTEAWSKAYNQMYKVGLRDTISDSFVLYDTDPVSFNERGFSANPGDDEIQWLGECVNLWFESAVNMGLRHSFSDGTTGFIDSPGKVESGVTHVEINGEFHGVWYVRDTTLLPTTTFDFYMLNKLTYLDEKRQGGRSYLQIPPGEVYLINPDYTRRNKQKIFNHLALEYDCCSDCIETFPHRWHWSEQAFQEELTDNFRMFLPNNYKDLEAETGEITDIFRVQNNLYIHTEEGLWHCPQTFQERVTNDVITFIGTGEYFSIPPRKMVDDSNSSAGNRHKWARTKTKYGILFPSWKEKKWYLFNGESLQPISDSGNSNYFKTHMDFLLEDQYYEINKREYPYNNNPSNLLGVGFLSTYDSNKERFIITKKDSQITNLPLNSYEICSEGSQTIIFPNMAQIIATRLAAGWDYIGIEDCKMKFEKTTYQTKTDTVTKFVSVSNDMDVWAFFDDTMEPVLLAQLEDAFDKWITDELEPSGWTGTSQKVYNSTEKWLNFPSLIPLADRGKVLLLSFVNEAVDEVNPYYNNVYKTIIVYVNDPLGPPPTYPQIPQTIVTSTLLMSFTGQPTTSYTTHYNNFTGASGVHSTFEKFVGICYPVISTPKSKNFLMHCLAAVKGRNYTISEVNDLPLNLYFSTTPALAADWETLKSKLLVNPYKTLITAPDTNPGLEQYGWSVISDKNNIPVTLATTDCPGSELMISPCQFALDMKNVLTSTIERTEVEITNTYPVTQIEYENGQVFVPQILNNGYTMSYSLKRQEWVSWHPYIPSFYMHVQEKFYSWPQGSNYIWKHNRPNHYQTFYGTTYPFIVEYVDNPSPLTTKVWDNILFQTEAKKFDPVSEEYLDQPNMTFNKGVFYNTLQTTGMLTLAPKQNDSTNYFFQQTSNTPGVVTVDRNERDWTLNNLKDYRKQDNLFGAHTVPMFLKNIASLQSNYYIDKVVNPSAIDYNKDWSQLESFRDKFLVVRLIFDNFADTRLIFNFSALDKKQSER
jgi:hypothetical protein